MNSIILRLSIKLPSSTPASGVSAATPRLQPLELCFPGTFTADDRQPICLCFHDIGSVSQGSATLTRKTPSPPSYIHEIPEVLDLTTTPSSSPIAFSPTSSSSSPRQQSATAAWCPNPIRLLVVLFAALGFLTLGFFSSQLLASRHGTALTADDGTVYILDHTAAAGVTAPIELSSHVLPIIRLRLSSAESLRSFVSSINERHPHLFFHLGTAIDDVCQQALVLTTPRQGVADPDRDDDISVVCHALQERVRHADHLWHGLSSHRFVDAFFTRPLQKLRSAAHICRLRREDDGPDQQAAALVRLYRRMLLDPDMPHALRWATSCSLCASPASGSLSPDDSGNRDEPPTSSIRPAAWHFACDANFEHALLPPWPSVSNPSSAVAYLRDWAARQSRRRFNSVHNPPLDVDGEPLFPNNQHPFLEADDVLEEKLVTEDDVIALTRHVFELSQGLHDLVTLLADHGLRTARSSPVPSGHERPGSEPSATSTWGWGWSQRSSIKGSAQPGSEWKDDGSICNSTSRLLEMNTDCLEPVARELAQASAVHALACRLTGRFQRHLAALEAGHGWTSLRSAVAEDENGVIWHNRTSHRSSPLNVIKLTHVRHVPDPLAEVDILEHEAEVLMSAVRRVLERDKLAKPHPLAGVYSKNNKNAKPDGQDYIEEEGWALRRRFRQGLRKPTLDQLYEVFGLLTRPSAPGSSETGKGNNHP